MRKSIYNLCLLGFAVLAGVMGIVANVAASTESNSNQMLLDPIASDKVKIDDTAASDANDVAAFRKIYIYLGLPPWEFGLGYRFNSHVGIEADVYEPVGSSSDDCGIQMLGSAGSGCAHEKLTTSYNQVTVIGALPVNLENDILIRLGIAQVSLDYWYSGTSCILYLCYSNVSGSGSASKFTKVYGIGWKKCFEQNLCWRVQYEDFGSIKMIRRYSNGVSNTADYSVRQFMVGLIYYIK